MSSVTFLYSLKTSENRRFSDVFRGYKNVTLDINGLKWPLWKLPSEIFCQNVWKMPKKLFIFNKVEGFELGTLLKMNFSRGIFQRFWPQISEQLFSTTPRSSCDCDINPFYPNEVFRVETTQFLYSTDQLTGFYKKDYIWIENVEAFYVNILFMTV